eukprot:GHUV01013985.1.p1 GENE.GHUV01013985.1~~GHUV01013985.1.p1  ORF type:complete len:1200 (+),score=534.70 GHUV01013985.1:114-3713(+)
MSGPSPEFEMARSAVGKITIDPKLKQQILEQSSLKDLYQQAGITRKQGKSGRSVNLPPDAAASSQAAALAAAANQLTYQKLVASAPMQKACAVVTQQLLRYMEQLYIQSSSTRQHVFQVALLVDNSGSMMRLADETKQAMVLLGEVLRRLEVSFAVVRFGRAHGQVILKHLNEPFSAQAMQLALESLTWDAGTYPASACEFVAREVFKDAPVLNAGSHASADSSSSSSSRQQATCGAAVGGEKEVVSVAVVHHRLVLALVDGLTQEMRAEDYISALEPKGIKFAVLNLYDKQQEELMGKINDLWAASADHVETLSKDNAADLPKVLAKLITSYLAQELQLVTAAASAAASSSAAATAGAAGTGVSSSGSMLAVSAAQVSAPAVSSEPYLLPVLCKGMAGIGSITYDTASLDGGVEPGMMYRHSPPGCLIPFAEAATAASSSGSIDSSDLAHSVDHAQARLAEYCSTMAQSSLHTAALQEVQQLWQQALSRPTVQGHVSRLVEVLESAVLPHNKHTRRRAEESGPTLHLPGLIKAAVSNYTSKKIFARKSAGGKRTYQVALLLDISQSMQGHLLQCGLEALLMFTEALNQAGLDGFAVMTFGSTTTLVKGADTPWDHASQLALLEQINCRPGHQLASMDAAAIQAAAALLTSSYSRAAKKVFVISDGYGTSGLALAAALQQAEQAGIEVVGLTVGFDHTHVPTCYQKWAAAALPASLPDALQALYTQEESAASASSMRAAAGEEWAELMPIMAGAASSVQEVLQQQSNVFGDLVRQLSRNKEAKLTHAQPDDMSVDVCFCLDVTGSMSGWIEACKAQIQAIADGLMPKIQKKCPDIQVKVRWGLVAYRDHGDQEQLQQLQLTEDSKELVRMVKKLEARGGGDEPEDIMAALSIAAQMDWKAKARFLVLIADAPAHGRECNDDPKDAHPHGSPRPGCDVPTVMQELRDKKVDLMLMPVKAQKLDKTAAVMRKYYDDPAEDRKLSSDPLFDGTKQPAHAFHFVFCLDGSGSMSGRPWQDLTTAYQQLLQRRNSDQCLGDLVSVVTFSDSPTVQITRQPISTVAQSFSATFGGTYFAPALTQCDALIAGTPAGYTPILIFMSDGCDGSSTAVGTMQQLYTKYRGRNLQVHTIAFGHSAGSGATLLQSMATAANGTYHAAASGLQLSQVFVQIAAECTAVDGLVKRFSEILSDMISIKVQVDYL